MWTFTWSKPASGEEGGGGEEGEEGSEEGSEEGGEEEIEDSEEDVPLAQRKRKVEEEGCTGLIKDSRANTCLGWTGACTEFDVRTHPFFANLAEFKVHLTSAH